MGKLIEITYHYKPSISNEKLAKISLEFETLISNLSQISLFISPSIIFDPSSISSYFLISIDNIDAYSIIDFLDNLLDSRSITSVVQPTIVNVPKKCESNKIEKLFTELDKLRTFLNIFFANIG